MGLLGGHRGKFDHNPIILEVAPSQEKQTNPFKLNPQWLKEEDFVNKIKDVWKPYDGNLRESAPIQFHQNMKEGKKAVTQWIRDKKKKDDRTLRKVEDALGIHYRSEGFGYMTEEHKYKVTLMEYKKRHILLVKDKEWRLTSRALWLQVGDENTKFFHRYANCRNNINSVSKLGKGYGMWETNFKHIVVESVNYFTSLFREDSQATIAEVTKLSNSFLSFVNHEEN